jgi:hypothetical protein
LAASPDVVNRVIQILSKFFSISRLVKRSITGRPCGHTVEYAVARSSAGCAPSSRRSAGNSHSRPHDRPSWPQSAAARPEGSRLDRVLRDLPPGPGARASYLRS